MSLARKLVSGVALPLLLAACEDDSVREWTGLTREESVALLKGAAVTFGQMLEDSTLIVESQDSIVTRCPLGGLAHWHRILIRETGDTARLVADLNINPTECAVEADGIQLTIDGAQRLDYFVSLQIIDATSEVNFAGTITGNVDWTLDDRSGNCRVDLRLDTAPDFFTRTLTGMYRGRACNYWVEIDAADVAGFLLVRPSGNIRAS